MKTMVPMITVQLSTGKTGILKLKDKDLIGLRIIKLWNSLLYDYWAMIAVRKYLMLAVVMEKSKTTYILQGLSILPTMIYRNKW